MRTIILNNKHSDPILDGRVSISVEYLVQRDDYNVEAHGKIGHVGASRANLSEDEVRRAVLNGGGIKEVRS